MKVTVDITPKEVATAVAGYLRDVAGITIDPDCMHIQVRSKQNFRDKEWEDGEIRVVFL